MPSNYTTNYHLNQWSRNDRVLMDDFNADNSAIEAALTSLEARVALLDRAIPNLAYYATQYALFDYKSTGKAMPTRGLLFDNFQYTDTYSVSGGTSVQNSILTTAAQNSGKMETGNMALEIPAWTRAIMWVHVNFTSGVTPKINGVEMQPNGAISTLAPGRNNVSCRERCFILDGQSGSSAAKITLEIENTSTSKALEVYDYTVFFF